MAPRHLDPKIKFVWMAPEASALVIIWLLASIGYVMLSVEISVFSNIPKIAVPFIFLIVLVLCGALPAFGWHHLTYVNFTYELSGHEIIIREGVLTRKRTVIPYARIQNINTERTLLERMLGLATIKIETAGANQNVSEGLIPGISNRDTLVSELLEEVEKTKKDVASGLESGTKAQPKTGAPQPPAQGGASGGAIQPIAPIGSVTTVTQEAVLKQILDELKSIKIILGEQASKKVDFSEMRTEENESRLTQNDEEGDVGIGGDGEEGPVERADNRPQKRRDPFRIDLENVRVKPGTDRGPEIRKQVSSLLASRKKKKRR